MDCLDDMGMDMECAEMPEEEECDEDAFFARNVARDPQFVTQLAVLSDRGDLVDDDAFHSPSPAARVCSEPGNDKMRA